MNYELAKALQDAGYPLRRIEGGMCVGPWPTLDMNPAGGYAIGAQHFYAPTLEELIEACGEPLKLYIMKNRTDISLAGPEIKATGATPKEAVARLWLALNKKI